MLPRHDEIGTGRRMFEAACVAAAAMLLGWHWTRFFVVPAQTPWWSLAFVPLGMAAADLASGLIHWAADTWGSESMPIIGRRLLHPFRVHHVNPDDFLERRFLDTNGDVALITIPWLVGMLWIPWTVAGGLHVGALMLGFCTAGLLTNQVHQWAHMPHPPRLVRTLQACGVILRRQAHARHHRAPHASDYCIATGWCNAVLNRTDFLRRLERAVTWLTGVVPRDDERQFQTPLLSPLSQPLPSGERGSATQVRFEAQLRQAERTSQHGTT